jgi:hypothetical protein
MIDTLEPVVHVHLFLSADVLSVIASYVDVMKHLRKLPEDATESRSQSDSQDNTVSEQLPYKHQHSSQHVTQSDLVSSPWSSKSSGLSELSIL